MKKSLLILVSIALTLSAFSQNLQLHFDPRKGLHDAESPFTRNYPTATFEMFKPDKWGSTFMFVDLDFNMSRGNIGLAYMEIARDQKIGNLPIKAHLEFNGGLGAGFQIENAYLLGASYGTVLDGWILGTYLTYKYNAFEKVSNDIQWTGTWSKTFLEGKLTATGFIDVWTENKNKTTGKGGKKIVLLTEPQFWYNVDKNLSFGTEIEISNRFYTPHYDPTVKDQAYVCPTIAAKWTF